MYRDMDIYRISGADMDAVLQDMGISEEISEKEKEEIARYLKSKFFIEDWADIMQEMIQGYLDRTQEKTSEV
jgi:hypothetical protein